MKNINFGIIGCGRITDLHVPGYAGSDDARIYAVCDLDRETAQRKARKWGAHKVYFDYNDMLDDPDVHAVEVITPHHLHKEICIAACRAGKHVSVQKPMALSVVECDDMIRAAREAGVKLRVFENFIFYPPYVKAKQLIDEGAIGEPLSIRIRMCSAGQGGWKVPLKSWLWRLNEKSCGGGPMIFDDGYHKFSIAVFFLGEVKSVNAWIDRSFGVVDAPAMISWEYKNGALGFIDCSFALNMKIKSKYYAIDERVEITGTEGMIQITRCTAEFLDEPPLMLFSKGRAYTYDNIRADWGDSFIDSVRHFIQCVRGETEPNLSGRTGRQVLQFALAAIQSAKSGNVIHPDEVV